MSKHVQFFARTVIVRNKDVKEAYTTLSRILKHDKVMETAKRNRYYEKPYQKRNRVAYEKCKRIYDDNMRRKINFISKTHRPEVFIYD